MEQKISSILNESLNELSLQFKMIETDLNLCFSFGCLENAQKQIVSYGSANGEYHSLKVISECIEHYFLRVGAQTSSVAIKDIANQKAFNKDQIIKNLESGVVIQTLSFKSLLETDKLVYIPASWCIPTDPKVDIIIPRSLYTSSGFSFGLDKQMAKQHGLLELIERHELSGLLYRLVKKIPLTIESLLLPQQEKKLSDLENQFEGKIKIFNIASEFSIPTILCLFFPNTSNSRLPLVQLASKTSFSQEDAIMGAINELTQIIGLYSEEEYAEDQAILENKALIDQHEQAIKLTQLINYQNQASTFLNREQLNFENLLIELNEKGYHPLERVVHQFSNGSCVLQVFVPGFERYNLVRLGKIVPVHGNFGVRNGLCSYR